MAHETVDTAIPAAGIELAGGDRAAALALFVQLDQRLETLLEGCSATDRWLDARGHECTETDAGAVWTDYTGEEQDAWLESVAGEIRDLKALAAKLRASVGMGQAAVPDAPDCDTEQITPQVRAG
jgi:hypothetical protein